LKLVPHKKFTFGKLWIFYANFSIRCNDLPKARKIFGRVIGLCPKEKVFREYIKLEEQLCQLDRVRQIYEKYC
jgi:crooked neck